MDNCDLEKISMSEGKLSPLFRSDVTCYTAIVESHVKVITLDLQTSDCGASYSILFGDGSTTIKLEDGLNKIETEVVAEDGTLKMYRIEVTKLSASEAKLSGLTIHGYTLHPDFSPNISDYSCAVKSDCCEVIVHPETPDKSMLTNVNSSSCSEPVLLNVGETAVNIIVLSADGANFQVYSVIITREQIPLAVTFCNVRDQIEFECPVTLNALYKPVSIHQSEPKNIFSAPYIDILTRRSKVDPFSERPLETGWKVSEAELDKTMSNATVRCFFSYRGCRCQMRFAEVGAHAKKCPHKPSADLDSKEVTETKWYRKYFPGNPEIKTSHTLEVRHWEKRLQTAVVEHNIDKLCAHAVEQLKLYREQLPKPGDMVQYKAGQSPLDHLEQAAICYATAVKVKPQNDKLHFLLGQTLEEYYYATEMYGLKKEAEEDDQDLGQAKSAGKQEEILAICRLQGFPGTQTTETQLKALDMEFQDLKQQGQSAKADYVQTLFLWLSKKAGKDGNTVVSDEKCWLHRALLKYLDAWTLSAHNWEYNLHVGRLLLLHGKHTQALQHLQTALALRPSQPAIRFYTGLALQQQQDTTVDNEQEAALFLQQGLEYVMSQFFNHDQEERERLNTGYLLSIVNAQCLRGCLSLGVLLSKHSSSGQAMSPEQVYHIVALLAAQGISRYVKQGEVTQQLEWVLLYAHFVLLQALIQQNRADTQAWISKRCRALTALIRLSSIAPCRELLDMQEKVCQMRVVSVPCCSHTLCQLGLAQLAQSDSDRESERGQVALLNACLSFKASIELEGSHQTGEPPEQLTKQKWWTDYLAEEMAKTVNHVTTEPKQSAESSEDTTAKKKGVRGRVAAARGGFTVTKTSGPTRVNKTATALRAKQTPQVARGRSGGVVAAGCIGVEKTPGQSSIKSQHSPCKLIQECTPLDDKPTTSAVEVGKQDSGGTIVTALNGKSHLPRLGLARALSRSVDSQKQACSLYQEVIDMAPEVHDAYIELADLLLKDDPLAAVEVYSRFPLKPVSEQTFDDAFITGEIVHILMKQELYDHPQLAPNMIAYGKVMGLGSLEKHTDTLERKFMTKLLKTVYAGIHDRSVNDQELQDFFKFKGWI